VTWTVAKGQIQGTGTQVTYVAPAQVGLDVVTVMDGGGNVATVKIVVTPLSQTQSLQMENANWEVFTNRSNIQALLLSDDGKTLWVGTNGGLEKRDAQTGEIQQVFINTDGLPSNNVTALISDGEGGLWVGTGSPRGHSEIGGGLAHYSAKGQWQIFNKDNSGLSNNDVTALLSDSQGGLWVGTYRGGVAHYTAQKQWQVFLCHPTGFLPC
jgi:ligand-binding sensor domain-containing protein